MYPILDTRVECKDSKEIVAYHEDELEYNQNGM